ncbi:MAG TPA: (p)ppGpp synthetase [Clostridiales bacterium]|nr:(p)ppGpp synthetase [Clostridiales bacterium]
MPSDRFEKLMNKIKEYHDFGDLAMVEKAYRVAYDAHKDQHRISGEPYIIHPIETAYILADLELDLETITAAILHDVVEDTTYTCEEIKELFNEEIAELVNGVTKLTKIDYLKTEEQIKAHSKEDIQAENYRRMFMAMAKDIRVILIKLADRLHNMRTLKHMPEHKQKQKAQETLDIYAALANRLGISKIKIELEDLSFRYLYPEEYYNIVKQIKSKKEERTNYVEDIIKDLQEKITQAEVKVDIQGRAKHFYSIYKKMKNGSKSIDEIYDLFAVRLIVDSVKDCYGVLGIVHELYKPMPNRFKDYIAMPKPNMYQSLHTTLIGPDGQPFEIQIRTWDMHRTSEYGIAAHWKYKEGNANKKSEDGMEQKLAWLREILEWQKDMSDSREFMRNLKGDLVMFNDEVFVFTPRGDVISLPKGSTPIDLAYHIHTVIGNKMVGAKVNDRIVTIDYVLKIGDRVEILTSQNSRGPSKDWINIVRTSEARNKINQWFKTELKAENMEKGKLLFEEAAKRKCIDVSKILKSEWMEEILKKYGLQKWDMVYALIGHGDLKESHILNRLFDKYKKANEKTLTIDELIEKNRQTVKKVIAKKSHSGITVKGVEDLAIKFSKCCSPVPGDEIIGYITKGRGISIHRTDCKNIMNLSSIEKSKLIESEWEDYEQEGSNNLYLADLIIMGEEREGFFFDVSKAAADMKVSLKAVSAKATSPNEAYVSITVEIKGKNQLDTFIAKLKNIRGVREINRVSG